MGLAKQGKAKLALIMGTSSQRPQLASLAQLAAPRHSYRVKPRVSLGCAAFCTSLWLVCAASPSPGFAQADPGTQHEYDALLDQAVDAFEAADFAHAHELFEQAYELRPNARVLRGLGIAALRLGHYTEASRTLAEALADTRQALTPAQRDEVSKLVAWMHTSLSVLRLRWLVPKDPTQAEVLLDDQPTADLASVLPPGAHRIIVRATGYRSQEHVVELEPGKDQELALSLVPEAPPPSAPAQAIAVAPAKAAATVASPAKPARSHAGLAATTAVHGAPHRRERSASVFDRWWFWTGLTVIAAGGVVTAIVLATAPSTKPYESGGLGGVLMLPLERHR